MTQKNLTNIQLYSKIVGLQSGIFTLFFLLILIGTQALADELTLNVSTPAASHFRQVGRLAGTTGMGHIVLTVDMQHQLDMMDELCGLPKRFVENLNNSRRLYTAKRYMFEDVGDHCIIMLHELMDRKAMWFAPWDGNIVKREVGKAAPQTLNDRNPYLSPLPRTRRQIAEIFSLGGLIMGASALYGQQELYDMVEEQSQKIDGAFQILNEQQTRISVNERSLFLLQETVSSLGQWALYTEEDVEYGYIFDHFSLTMSNHFEETRRVLRGWDGILSHRINPDILKYNETQAALLRLRRHMATQGYEVAINHFNDIFRLDNSHVIYPNGTMLVIIHVPAMKYDTSMALYEYVQLPYHLGGTHTDPTGNQVVEDYTMEAQPEHRFLALSDDGDTFRAYTQVEMDRCKRYDDHTFCDNSVYDRKRSESCLVNLYREQIELVKKNCLWNMKTPQDYAMQIQPNTFVLYHVEEVEARLLCGEDLAVAMIAGLTQVKVPATCRLWTPSFVLDGQANFSVGVNSFVPRGLKVSVLLDEMKLDGNHSEIFEALKKLELVGSAEGIKLEDVREKLEIHHKTSLWRRVVEIIILTIVCFIPHFKIDVTLSPAPCVFN